jgi:hypothetical protein
MKAMPIDTCKSFREIFHASPRILPPIGHSFHRPVDYVLVLLA